MAGKAGHRRAGLVLALAAFAGCSSGEEPLARAPPVPAPAPAPAPAPVPAPPPPVARPAAKEEEPAPWEREKDPVRARTLKLEEEWRLDPEFTDMKLRFFDEGPALVAVETGKGPFDEGTTGAMGERTARALAGFVPRFQAFLREAGLDPPSLADLGDERVRVMIFRSKESLDAWSVRMRFPATLSPYYGTVDRRIVGWAGEFDLKAVQYLGTLALLHLYRRHFCQVDDDAAAARRGEPRETVAWDDRRLLHAFDWFQHGLAKYFASNGQLDLPAGEWRSAAPDAEDRGMYRYARGLKRLWPLEDFLFCDGGQMRNRARTMAAGGQGERTAHLAAVQGTFLIRYFLDGEKGRWRPAFFAMVRHELHGQSGIAYLLEAFGLLDARGKLAPSTDPTVTAFIKEVEAGYLAYADSLQ